MPRWIWKGTIREGEASLSSPAVLSKAWLGMWASPRSTPNYPPTLKRSHLLIHQPPVQKDSGRAQLEGRAESRVWDAALSLAVHLYALYPRAQMLAFHGKRWDVRNKQLQLEAKAERFCAQRKYSPVEDFVPLGSKEVWWHCWSKTKVTPGPFGTSGLGQLSSPGSVFQWF